MDSLKLDEIKSDLGCQMLANTQPLAKYLMDLSIGLIEKIEEQEKRLLATQEPIARLGEWRMTVWGTAMKFLGVIEKDDTFGLWVDCMERETMKRFSFPIWTWLEMPIAY